MRGHHQRPGPEAGWLRAAAGRGAHRSPRGERDQEEASSGAPRRCCPCARRRSSSPGLGMRSGHSPEHGLPPGPARAAALKAGCTGNAPSNSSGSPGQPTRPRLRAAGRGRRDGLGVESGTWAGPGGARAGLVLDSEQRTQHGLPTEKGLFRLGSKTLTPKRPQG